MESLYVTPFVPNYKAFYHINETLTITFHIVHSTIYYPHFFQFFNFLIYLSYTINEG